MQQATPPLLSLKVRRTVDTILELDTTEQKNHQMTTTPLQKARQQQTANVDHSGEIARITDILEKQSFAFVAYMNKVKDAKKRQDELMNEFHDKADLIRTKLSKIQTSLLRKILDLNKRVEVISRNLALKPTFISMLPPNEFGRITGMISHDNILICTSASGYLIRINIETFTADHFLRYSDSEALFQPFIYTHGPTIVSLCLSSSRSLLIGLPGEVDALEKCIETPIESYAINMDANTRDVYEIALGENNQIEYAIINTDISPKLTIVNATKKLRGIVTAIATDQEQNAVFALTSRRMFYSISGTNFNVIYSETFEKPVMQLATTQCFVIISIAPNDIMIIEKNREKFNKLYNITIENGLRRFFAASNELLVIMKDQRVQRRRLCDISSAETICEQEAADYNEEEYIGVIYEVDRRLYLSHGNRISFWQ